MNTPFLDFLERLMSAGADRPLITRFVHGPIAAALVKLTPNPYDDLFLEIAKKLFPKT